MNLNALMPFVIIFGILVIFVVLRLARGGFGGGIKRSPLARQLGIVWFVIVLVVLLFLFLYRQRERQSHASQSEQPEAGSGTASTVQTNH